MTRGALLGNVIALTCGIVVFVMGLTTLLGAHVYTVRIYAVGGQTPLFTGVFQAVAVTCDLASDPNARDGKHPSEIEWSDRAHPGRVCLWRDDGTGPLLRSGLPGGKYEATLAETIGEALSDESARVPFSLAGPPPLKRPR